MGLQSRVTPHARQLRECALLGLSIGWAGGWRTPATPRAIDMKEKPPTSSPVTSPDWDIEAAPVGPPGLRALHA
eukprot:scaffold6479_cov101-Isochrysis_galbana.AAC.1